MRSARALSLLCLAGLLATVLALANPTVAAAAGPVPECLPGQTDGNCIHKPSDDLPPQDPPPELPPPTPLPGSSVLLQQNFGASMGPPYEQCPFGGIPFDKIPCTLAGVNVGARAYVPPGTERPPSYAFSMSPEPYGGCDYSYSCNIRLVYNPKAFSGDITLIVGVYVTTVLRVPNIGYLGSSGYEFTITIHGTAEIAPTADFTASPDTTQPGTFIFSSTSTDPGNLPLSLTWNFGDGASGAGAFTTHAYAKPGTYNVELTARNQDGLTSTRTRAVVVAAPKLELSLTLLDDARPPLDPDQPVRVKTTVGASSDGLGALSGITFDDSAIDVSPDDMFEVTAGPDPTPAAGGFSLAPGQETSFITELQPSSLGSYTLSSAVTGKDAAGRTVKGSASTNGVVGTALKVQIVLDPPHIKQKEEEGKDPEPVDVDVTVKLTNTTPDAMTDVNLRSLRVDRTKPGQLLDITQTGGVEPDDVDGFPVGPIAAGATKELHAQFTAKDDAEAEFSALATGVADGHNVTGLGKARWSVEPTYFARLSMEVVQPANDSLLPAGDPIRLKGYVKNLSNSATLDLGTLFPELKGNAGVMSLAYDDVGTDPKDLVAPPLLHLEPGESKNFTVRVTTGYSDPRGAGEVQHSGGTRATLTFTPWGTATLEDGSTVEIKPEEFKVKPEDLEQVVHIDDSIPIPGGGVQGALAVGGGMMVGGVEGVYSAVVATLLGTVEIVKLPYTAIVATSEYQSKVWSSFTPAEKDAFASDASYMIVAVLLRNAELGKKDAGELYKQVKATTLKSMIDMQNDWAVGDYAQTARLYTRFGSDAIAQVAVPIALAKLAKAPQAVAALKKFQDAIQVRMAPVLAEVATIERVEAMAPMLELIEAGTELNLTQIAEMYGITAEELAELQKLSTKYKFLLTVRSRHASSIEWIKKAGALLKPEALKIKSVSELDARLGYNAGDVGSLVFKKPTPLAVFEHSGGDLASLTESFVKSKGFTPGTPDYVNAIKRIGDRVEEWKEWEGKYKQWAKRGWIDVSFNYKGNAIDDTVRKGTGQYRGFKLKAVGDEEYVVQMLDGKTGRYVPITGDIDPIAFTHLDGSPLSAVEHAQLLDDLRKNPLLAASHGESATYVDGGVDFIAKQFKGEAGLMIAPGELTPRTVRFNKGESRWISPFDYNLHWEGGFIFAGESPKPAAFPLTNNRLSQLAAAEYQGLASSKALALPGRPIGADANVGRCRFSYSTGPSALPLELGASGSIEQVVDGRLQAWAGSDECFGEGPTIEVAIAPSTEVGGSTAAGLTELPVAADPYLAGVDPATGFAVGQQVTINPGGPNQETRTISGFGSLLFDSSLVHAHAAGEVVLVTGVVTAGPSVPDAATPVVTPVANLSGNGAPSSGAATPGATTVGGTLPQTGSTSGSLVGAGLTLLLLGSALLAAAATTSTRRRPHPEPGDGGDCLPVAGARG